VYGDEVTKSSKNSIGRDKKYKISRVHYNITMAAWTAVNLSPYNSDPTALAPGSRFAPSVWVSAQDRKAYIFGGSFHNSTTPDCYECINHARSDIWRHDADPVSGSSGFVFVGGSQTANINNNYLGYPSSSNFPASRGGAMAWYEQANNTLVLWGGRGGPTPPGFPLGGLWKFRIGDSTWDYLAADTTAFGAVRKASSTFSPGRRSYAAVGYNNVTQDLWFFGGLDTDLSMNDLWMRATYIQCESLIFGAAAPNCFRFDDSDTKLSDLPTTLFTRNASQCIQLGYGPLTFSTCGSGECFRGSVCTPLANITTADTTAELCLSNGETGTCPSSKSCILGTCTAAPVAPPMGPPAAAPKAAPVAPPVAPPVAVPVAAPPPPLSVAEPSSISDSPFATPPFLSEPTPTAEPVSQNHPSIAPTITRSPLAEAPTQVVSIDCELPVPFPGAICIGGVWKVSGNITINGTIAIGNTTVIQGSINITTGGSVRITVTSVTPPLTVTDCVEFGGRLEVSLPPSQQIPASGKISLIKFDGGYCGGTQTTFSSTSIDLGCRKAESAQIVYTPVSVELLLTGVDDSGCNNSAAQSAGGLTTGAMAGIAVGIILLALVGVGITVFFLRHKIIPAYKARAEAAQMSTKLKQME
jgi:hypothetical protein